ncbi:MAG: membrane protein insertion efficiency factor YidD [Candidatus Caenarcaniphilales bacterium]|nr:membrane protein insertion efficiency factor YidD [Candidatus Caenarcaniphilales bacterium]
MRKLLIKLIHLYQRYKPWNTASCRFTPTCSNYMIEAIEKKGAIKGVFLGLMRILKCNPLGPYGYDPVND